MLYLSRSKARVVDGVPCPQNGSPSPSSIRIGERYSVPWPLRCYAGWWTTPFRRFQGSYNSSKQSSSHLLDHPVQLRCQVAWIYRGLRRAPFLLLGSASETGDQTRFEGLLFLPSSPLPSSATDGGCSSIRWTCFSPPPILLGWYDYFSPLFVTVGQSTVKSHHGACWSRSLPLERSIWRFRCLWTPHHFCAHSTDSSTLVVDQPRFSARMAQILSPTRKSYVIGSSRGTWSGSITSLRIKISSGISPLYQDHISAVWERLVQSCKRALELELWARTV